jgi:hypothetical protein
LFKVITGESGDLLGSDPAKPAKANFFFQRAPRFWFFVTNPAVCRGPLELRDCDQTDTAAQSKKAP